nr:citron Rho-interacting kinase [Leptinotarsa decemlineata]
MEHSKDPITVRIARINGEITGQTAVFNNTTLLARETLLDILQALYEECSLENLQKYDTNIAKFVEKYKETVKEIKKLRVNITDFEIKNVIGRGHFGEVHLVKEKQTGDIYAMKTVRKFENDLNRMSFEIERNIMAFSNSHWLTTLQYSFQDSTYLFFVMEYHPGGDLLGLLYRQGGTLPESAATFYISELVLALEDLHLMGYIHRDIKPDNILLDRCGHLKLADFGSAAKLNQNGVINVSPPVGTPDYIAPEVLQCLENKNEISSGYGVSCDYWSLGVLAYELTIGNTPFTGQNSTSIYSKIMNHQSSLKFPPDVVLSQAYVSFVKSLITDEKSRLTTNQIRSHPIFKNTNFDTLRDQVPPFVPKITSVEDTSNFSDVQSKKKTPSIESFKKRMQFSGRNLPFIGFTFTPNPNCYQEPFERKVVTKDEMMENLKSEVNTLRMKMVKNDEFDKEREALERKLEEKTRKLESIENLRNRLERDLAGNIAECGALKRTLELERKDRSELEKKAIDLIKSAKLKWEAAEKNKLETLTLEISQQKEKIIQLTATNNMLTEQVQHALKMEGKHKESLEKAQFLSRHSVIGLESRLEKVTSETQDTISELEKQLSEEIRQKKKLENKMSQMKMKESLLTKKIDQSEKDFESWKNKLEEAENIIKQFSEQVTDLENHIEKIDEYKQEIAQLQEKLDEYQKTVEDVENHNTTLQLKVKHMEGYKMEVEELKKTIRNMQNDKKFSDIQNQLLEEREKCMYLTKQLQEFKNIATENEELKELRTKYWRMEKELNNAKIDKRILERELKDSRSDVKLLNEKIEGLEKSLGESKHAHELAIVELSNINEKISLELIKLKGSHQTLLEKLDFEKTKYESDKIAINELKDIIKLKDDQIARLNIELACTEKEKSAVENEIKKIENENGKLLNSIENLQKEKNEIQDNLQRANREVLNKNLNLEALREACTVLENQLIAFEEIKTSFETKQAALNSNTEKLISDLCKSKQEIQVAKKAVNEEKSLRLLAETKVKRLSEDVECLQKECASYKKQCIDYKQFCSNLSEELTVAEEKITDLEVTAKAYERHMDELKSENRHIKQELSDIITQFNKGKESNYKLKHQLSDTRDEMVMFKQKMNELERILNEKSHYYKEREMKSDATIKQQIKLIDFLQSKIDEQNNKKRTFTNVLFGNSKKENQPPISLVMNYKDLESQLLKEKKTNKELQEEIFKLKAIVVTQEQTIPSEKIKVLKQNPEIMSPKSKVAIQQIVNSPSKQKNDFYRRNSVQRMHHNIPHRFDTKYCKSSTICAACSQQVSLGRSFIACSDCNVQAHTNCKRLIPNTCGLPKVFAKHYKDSLKPKTEENHVQTPNKEEVVNVEGWVKILGKMNTWEKHYAVLTDSSINIYTDLPKENNSTLLETFPLKPANSHGKVISEPLPSEIGVAVANSDLAFILKVEVAPDTTCWPPNCLIILTLSAQDKDKWFLALQKIYNDDNKPKFEKILTIEEDMQVVSLVDLTETIKIIGTEQGLYSYFEKNLVHIDGLKEVHHISIMSSTNCVLMIVNEKRTLIVCDINHLINLAQCAQCSKPKLNYKDVDISGLNGFHILQVSSFTSQLKICVATAKQLVVLSYESDIEEFVPARILDTAEPVSCALFTENSLIVGADKFFEIDLVTFRAEEFLDASDIRLKQAERCYKMGSFPLAIIQICKNPKEYLLCFSEFSVFVDEFGRSTRSTEIKSNHLPVAFHFTRPYLFTAQFAAIEILKITEDTCNNISDSESTNNLDTFRLEMDKYRYIGYNKKGIFIVLGTEIKFIDAKKNC